MSEIDKKWFYEIYENALLQSLSGVWYPFSYGMDFETNKTDFLLCLEIFLNDNKLRLAKHGRFLEGTIYEQVELFRNAFPTEEQMKEVVSYWWHSDDCPAGAVWIIDNEIEGFTTQAEDGKFYYWT